MGSHRRCLKRPAAWCTYDAVWEGLSGSNAEDRRERVGSGEGREGGKGVHDLTPKLGVEYTS